VQKQPASQQKVKASPAATHAQALTAPAASFFFRIGSILILGSAVLCLSRPAVVPHGGTPMPDALRNFPRIILWAWERPEDLRFLDHSDQPTAVAFLARTLYLRGADVVVRPRFQPLRVSPETPLMAVVRIEPQRDARLKLSPDQAKRAAQQVAEAAQLPRVTALQVDFDAVRSEREFYRQLLIYLRHEVPTSMPISITALASWCMDDDWITGLPVDEAVPMLFRMGVDHGNVVAFLSHNNEFNTALCRQSIGISTDEPLSNMPKKKRVYVFNDKSWDRAWLEAAMQKIAVGRGQ
jgi:hypothetical protein